MWHIKPSPCAIVNFFPTLLCLPASFSSYAMSRGINEKVAISYQLHYLHKLKEFDLCATGLFSKVIAAYTNWYSIQFTGLGHLLLLHAGRLKSSIRKQIISLRVRHMSAGRLYTICDVCFGRIDWHYCKNIGDMTRRRYRRAYVRIPSIASIFFFDITISKMDIPLLAGFYYD